MKRRWPTIEAFEGAAEDLGCDVAAVQAVADVEAGQQGAFIVTDKGDEVPVILYERHYFHRLTGGQFDGAKAPGLKLEWAQLSLKGAGGYGPVRIQHQKLEAAAKLDREAALKSCSWGLFQIMGANHAAAGHPTIQSFVNGMYRDVDAHLFAFTRFILHDPRLLAAIRARDWAAFARGYNGPHFAANRYDAKMAAAWEQRSGAA